MAHPPSAAVAPVEYAVAVNRYLAEAGLGAASCRVYRISLTSWAWPLVGKLPPPGRSRRLACPPVVPLALLDSSDARGRLAAAVSNRAASAQARTLNRELSALRSAVGWWQRRHWIESDPTADLRPMTGRPVALTPLTSAQRTALFQAPVGLREQALWHLVQDTGASAQALLGLEAGSVDLAGRQARLATGELIGFESDTADLLSWLLAGRRSGPLFSTGRRAPAGTPARDVCPLTGCGRMSYRRAAEIFTEWSRPLDPAGRGWTLHQLRPQSRMLAAGESPRFLSPRPAQTR